MRRGCDGGGVVLYWFCIRPLIGIPLLWRPSLFYLVFRASVLVLVLELV